MKKGSSAPAPVAAPAPQVQTPDVDVAQTAAMKALAAQGDVRNAQAAEDEADGNKPATNLAQAQPVPGSPPKKKRLERDPASVANAVTGGMSSSAVLTG